MHEYEMTSARLWIAILILLELSQPYLPACEVDAYIPSLLSDYYLNYDYDYDYSYSYYYYWSPQ